MRLEAIAALLGHRTMEMTLIYARIADRVVADEYQAISEKIDALYGQQLELPADYETTGMAKLRREAHARMLGNGLCTRPVQLDCRMESACETCSYFQTTIEFRPTLQRQRDHAQEHGQPERAAIFDELIHRASQDASPSERNVTIPDVRLAAGDAAELTELLNFLIDWINSDPAAAVRITAAFCRQQRLRHHSPPGRPGAPPVPPRRRRTDPVRRRRLMTRP